MLIRIGLWLNDLLQQFAIGVTVSNLIATVLILAYGLLRCRPRFTICVAGIKSQFAQSELNGFHFVGG